MTDAGERRAPCGTCADSRMVPTPRHAGGMDACPDCAARAEALWRLATTERRDPVSESWADGAAPPSTRRAARVARLRVVAVNGGRSAA